MSLLNRSGNEVVLVGSLPIAAWLTITPAHGPTSVEATAAWLESASTSIVAIACWECRSHWLSFHIKRAVIVFTSEWWTSAATGRWSSVSTRWAAGIVFWFLATIALVTPREVLVLASRADPIAFSGLTARLTASTWASGIVVSWRTIVISTISSAISCWNKRRIREHFRLVSRSDDLPPNPPPPPPPPPAPPPRPPE